MRRRSLAAALAAFGVLGALGCDRPVPAPDVVASIAGREIPYAEFESYLRRQAVEAEVDLGSDVLSGLFDQFLEEELLRRLAVDRGVASEADDAWTASRALVESAAGGPVDPQAVAAYYERHRSRFELPPRVRVRQILVEERESAESALAALAAGERFDRVADRLAGEEGALDLADQGLLSLDDLPPALADTIFDLEPGETSEIVEADYGYHIFQVTERLPAGVVPLDLAAPEIREILRRRAADQRLGELVEEASAEYDLEVYSRNLPFNYEGSHAS